MKRVILCGAAQNHDSGFIASWHLAVDCSGSGDMTCSGLLFIFDKVQLTFVTKLCMVKVPVNVKAKYK